MLHLNALHMYNDLNTFLDVLDTLVKYNERLIKVNCFIFLIQLCL